MAQRQTPLLAIDVVANEEDLPPGVVRADTEARQRLVHEVGQPLPGRRQRGNPAVGELDSGHGGPPRVWSLGSHKGLRLQIWMNTLLMLIRMS